MGNIERWVIVPRPMTGEPALAYPADMDLSGLFDADRIEVVPASQLKGAVDALDEVVRALESGDNISLAHLRAVRASLVPSSAGGQ